MLMLMLLLLLLIMIVSVCICQHELLLVSGCLEQPSVIEFDLSESIGGFQKYLKERRIPMSSEILHLDTRVTEDFINGKAGSNGATRSTATHLFLNDHLIAY